MEEIIQYKALDGTIFATKDEALAHELQVSRVSEIIDALGATNPAIRNGSGYIQHDSTIVRKIKERFYLLALKTQGFEGPDENGAPDKYTIGRRLGDSQPMLYDVWNRLHCIDDAGREFDQQFFTMHPHKCVMKKFNAL